MNATASTRNQFISVLNRIAQSSENPETLTADLRAALLAFASETPDNLACAEKIEVGVVGESTGTKLIGQDRLMSDIAHHLEGVPMPAALKEALPDMSESDWDAYTRFMTLVCCLLEQDS